jgi:hypothetical protein
LLKLEPTAMRRRTSQDDYNLLAERAAEDPRAMRELQYYHKIKGEGGAPEITWSRRDGFAVRDKYALPRKPLQ